MSSKEKAVVVGVHPVLELLKSGERPVEKIYLLKGRSGGKADEILRLARSLGVLVHFEVRAVLERYAEGQRHQGVVALTGARGYRSLDEVIARSKQTGRFPLILLLDGVEDPRNLGAIVRTAEAAGVDGVVLPRHRAVGLTAAVDKASAGALEHQAVTRVTNLGRTLEELKAEGFWSVGLDPSAERRYTELDYRMSIALIAGGEGQGIRSGVLKKCDFRVSIPMRGAVDSLNVSVAVAVVLFEIIRQREIPKVL